MDFSFADKINTALFLITALGVVAAFWQIRLSARTQRAIFLKDLYMQLNGDPNLIKAYYLIEYDLFKYDENFHNSTVEADIDRLLTIINLICELYQQGIISKREMSFFDYRFKRVSRNNDIKKYLESLKAFYTTNDVSKKPFEKFQEYVGD